MHYYALCTCVQYSKLLSWCYMCGGDTVITKKKKTPIRKNSCEVEVRKNSCDLCERLGYSVHV